MGTKLQSREQVGPIKLDRLNRFKEMESADDVKQKEAEVDTLLSKPAAFAMGNKVTEKESEAVEEEDKRGKYPWPLLVRTVLLLNAFLALGINDAMGGPTLLDLRDLVGATIAQVSFIFAICSIGSLIGCFLTGALMDRIPNACYLFLASTLLLLGHANSSLPYSPSLFVMYFASFFKGLASGSLDTGGNVLLLRIWEGRDSGPYMHAIHFTFGIGAFLAPLIARPFLVNTEDTQHLNGSIRAAANLTQDREVEESVWTVKTLYPMVSAYPLLLSLVFVAFHVKDRKTAKKGANKEDEGGENQLSKGFTIAIVATVSVLFFLYVGMEVAFGTFVSVFAVQSKLQFTRQQGSDVTAVFWGTFAATRGLAIFAAIVASPNIIMWTSFTISGIGSIILCIWGDTYPEALYVGTALLGIGMASIFATGFLWVERRMKVTARIGSAFLVASSSGADVFPLVVGQLVEDHPMGFIYLTTGIWASCLFIFTMVSLIALKGERSKTSLVAKENHLNG